MEKYVLKLYCLTNKEICNQRISKEASSNDVRKRKNKYFTLGGNQSNSLFMSGEKCAGGKHKPPSKNNEEII